MNEPVHYHEGRFPPTNLDWEQLASLIGSANAAVARYDGMLAAIPNAYVLLSPLTTQEAVLSSRIEGTQATMGEVLEYEARGETDEPTTEKEADIWEILNYRKAMRGAIESLKTVPLCQRIILECHKILLNSVRGHGKAPGQYRRVPNWIGPAGCSIENARYVPIDAHKLPEAMARWENFIRAANIPKPTAQRILNVLKNGDILKVLEEAGGRKAAVLAYPELLNIAEGRRAF